jgi:hypothetical protein
VLCCAGLCWAVLGCAVLGWAVLGCAGLCWAVLGCAVFLGSWVLGFLVSGALAFLGLGYLGFLGFLGFLGSWVSWVSCVLGFLGAFNPCFSLRYLKPDLQARLAGLATANFLLMSRGGVNSKRTATGCVLTKKASAWVCLGHLKIWCA